MKGLRKMPIDVSGRFVKNFEQLAEDNEEGLDIKALQGRDGFRMRVREWRAIYKIDDDRLVILVLDTGPRGGFYR